MAWHDMTWHDMTWHDINGMAWHDRTGHGMALHYITLHCITLHIHTYLSIVIHMYTCILHIRIPCLKEHLYSWAWKMTLLCLKDLWVFFGMSQALRPRKQQMDRRLWLDLNHPTNLNQSLYPDHPCCCFPAAGWPILWLISFKNIWLWTKSTKCYQPLVSTIRRYHLQRDP